MMTYVTAFIFYTLAMIGILLIGFVVYKKSFLNNAKGENRGVIKIIDSLPIGNKKMLLVVKIKNEKFLIASGLEHTTFLSKLDSDSAVEQIKEKLITPEVVEESIIDEIYGEPIVQEAPRQRFDDTKISREMELQRQFRELYEKDETPKPQINSIATSRKEMVKQLLRDLNATSNAKNGSKF